MTDTRFFAILAAMTAAAISVSAYDIDLEPDAAKRRTVTVFKSQGPQTASLYLKAPSPWVIAGSAITAQDDNLWSAVSTTPNTRTHVYQMVNAHSSQQHVSIFGFLTQPGPGPGRNPWFKATVPAVDIDWEAHSGAGHESDEDAWTGLCPVTTDQSRRSKIIVRPLKDDFGLVSGWMTLECWPTDGVRFLKEDGTTALWHGASVSYSETPLTLYVDPVPEKAGPFTVTLKGDMDDAFNRPTDYLTGRAVLLDLDVDADNNGAINEADDPLEETPGGIQATGTVKQVALRLAPAGLTGTLKLLAVSGGSHIRLWRDAGKTSSLALSDAEWELSGGYTFPTALYVEGIDASVAVRDVHLCLRYTAEDNQQIDDYIKMTVFKVELELKNTGTIVASPENEDYDAEKNSAGGTDQIGPLPMGQGREGIPGLAYTSPIMVIGNVSPKPIPTEVEFRWKRMITRRSWFILKNAAGTEWYVTQRTHRVNEDDTGGDAFNDPTPSPALGKIYIYDCSALAPATEAASVKVGDYIREEKAFRYSVEYRTNGGAWSECASKNVGQIIRVSRKATTGTVVDDWEGLENSNAERLLDALIDEADLRGTVGGTLPIIIDANANN